MLNKLFFRVYICASLISFIAATSVFSIQSFILHLFNPSSPLILDLGISLAGGLLGGFLGAGPLLSYVIYTRNKRAYEGQGINTPPLCTDQKDELLAKNGYDEAFSTCIESLKYIDEGCQYVKAYPEKGTIDALTNKNDNFRRGQKIQFVLNKVSSDRTNITVISHSTTLFHLCDNAKNLINVKNIMEYLKLKLDY